MLANFLFQKVVGFYLTLFREVGEGKNWGGISSIIAVHFELVFYSEFFLFNFHTFEHTHTHWRESGKRVVCTLNIFFSFSMVFNENELLDTGNNIYGGDDHESIIATTTFNGSASVQKGRVSSTTPRGQTSILCCS